MRGRKPVPTTLRLLQGNPGHRPLNLDEPQPVGDLEVPPDWLSDDQKEIWRFAISRAPRGLLKLIDGSVFLVWVTACDLHQQAVIQCARLGLIIKSPRQGEPIQNPYLAIVNKQASIMMKAAAELGFSPSARTRIKMNGTGDGPKQGNKFSGIGRAATGT